MIRGPSNRPNPLPQTRSPQGPQAGGQPLPSTSASAAPQPNRPPALPGEANLPPRTSSLAYGGHGQAASMSPHPPKLQLMRHIRSLVNAEKNHLAGSRPGTEAHKLHKRNVGYLQRYEQVMEGRYKSALGSEQARVDGAHRHEKADLARLQKTLKPVEKDLKWAEGKLAKLEGEKAGIEKQLAVLGARAKGDKGPVKFTEKIKSNGVVKRLAEIDLGNPGKGLKGLFSRGPRLDKLSREDLQSMLGEVKGDMEKVQGWMKEYQDERAGILQRPRYERPLYPAVNLPSREEVLKTMHASQPLRKTEFMDPLAKADTDAGKPSGPELRSALKPFGPRPNPEGKTVTFAPDIAAAPQTPPAPPTRPPRSPFRPEPPMPDQRALGASIERPGNPIAKTFEQAESRARTAEHPLGKPLPTPPGPRPTEITPQEGRDLINRVRQGESIRIPPGGLAYNGEDGRELII